MPTPEFNPIIFVTNSGLPGSLKQHINIQEINNRMSPHGHYTIISELPVDLYELVHMWTLYTNDYWAIWILDPDFASWPQRQLLPDSMKCCIVEFDL